MAEVINSNNNIIPGLRADIMRKAMETKDLLKNKGSIYVGTGETPETVEGYDLYKTEALELGTNGYLLCADRTQNLGVHWRSIGLGEAPTGYTNLLTSSNDSTGITFSFECEDVLT